jgi:pimeloyl-ACP methyl ester carboxylesterase
MKRYMGIYDKNEEEKLKHKVISFTNIPEEYVSFMEIYVDSTEYVHVLYIDDRRYKNKKDLMMIHGFGGTAFNFFKLFPSLSKKYRIVGIDLPGMGLYNIILF